MSNDTTNTTFSATAARADIAAHTSDYALELEDYDGYVADAIFDIADGGVSTYTRDNIEYCREHSGDVKEALSEGLALDPRNYFDAHPGHDYEDYEAHLGAIAEYMAIECEIHNDLEEGIEYAVLGALKTAYGDDLLTEAYEYIRKTKTCDWDDNNERVDSITSEAVELYAEFIEEESEDD